MIMHSRAEPGLVIAAGAMVGLLGGVAPLAMGLSGGAASLSAAIAAALATGLAAAWRCDNGLARLGIGRDEPADLISARLAAMDATAAALALVGEDGTIRRVNGSFRNLMAQLGPDLRRHHSLPADSQWVGSDIRLLLPDYDTLRSQPSQTSTLQGDDACLGLRLSPLPDGAMITLFDLSDSYGQGRLIDAILQQQLYLELALDGRILAANAAAAALAGLDPATMEGRMLGQVLALDGQRLLSVIARAADAGFATETLCLPDRSGRDLWFDCRFMALHDGGGPSRRLICLGNDVTARIDADRAAEAQRKAAAEAQARIAQHLGEGLTALAMGDLTHRIETIFPAQYEPLRLNYNSAIDRLAEALGQVIGVTASIRNGAAEMNAAAEDLSRRTEGQAATLEETAAALDELTASVRSAAESAASADKSVRNAHREAEESGRVVTDAVDAMGQIERSSRQISQIIGVIDEIAFQTNLLALNAGVEAARAGEAGRGFAVVASEVRALAQRSSAAAREIKELISASSRQVENGVTLVGQAGNTLRAIVDGVTDIAERVSALAQSSREQANGITEINSGVTMLDQVTQQNAAMVEQSTASSQSLHRAAESLATLMQRFRLNGLPTGIEAPQQTMRDPKVTQLRVAEIPSRDQRPVKRAAAAPAGWEEF